MPCAKPWQMVAPVSVMIALQAPAAIIKPGKNGILVELGDKAAFSKQLSALMNDESMIKNLSVAAYTIRETLHENNILAKWELLISEILKQRK